MKGDKHKKEIDLIWRIINKKYSYVSLSKFCINILTVQII